MLPEPTETLQAGNNFQNFEDGLNDDVLTDEEDQEKAALK
jgi:hypothetical protein